MTLHMIRTVRALTGALALVPCALLAQANPWNGQWKADPASLKYQGATFTMATNADGYTVSVDGKTVNTIVCDGSPHPQPDSPVMVACTKDGGAYMLTATRDGNVVSKTRLSISSDGKMATRQREVMPPNAAPYTVTDMMTRRGGGNGLDGTWQETSFTESQDTGILSIQVHGDSIDFKETDQPTPMMLKLDGTDVSVGMGKASAKLVDPHTLKIFYKNDQGKVMRENTFTLSSDGRTIHETDETPAPGPTTMHLTLHKS